MYAYSSLARLSANPLLVLLASKSANAERKITVLRVKHASEQTQGTMGTSERGTSSPASSPELKEKARKLAKRKVKALIEALNDDEQVLSIMSALCSVDGAADALPSPPELVSNTMGRIVDILAPPGRLGITVSSRPVNGTVCVDHVKEDSPLLDAIFLEDEVIAVDDEDVSQMTARDVSSKFAVHILV